ncbi:MAG: hypothetical protein ACI81L_000954 [Verrucomicrobiales bacterium]|jgi:hypothetical protein
MTSVDSLLGWLPFGTGTHHYRRGHANHHRDEFGPNEPDFLLYSFYPITFASMRRKLRRDATGVSAYRLMKPRFTGLLKAEYRSLSLRFFLGQLLVFGAFALAGEPLLYLVLWVVPFLTCYQVQNRLRSIAEHAGMTRSPDPTWCGRTIALCGSRSCEPARPPRLMECNDQY